MIGFLKDLFKCSVLIAVFTQATTVWAADSAALSQSNQPATIIKGGGSQPIANLYVVWGKTYEARHSDVSMTYKVSNVVKGIEDLEANKIDYAGSEIPLKMDELKKKVCSNFLQR